MKIDGLDLDDRKVTFQAIWKWYYPVTLIIVVIKEKINSVWIFKHKLSSDKDVFFNINIKLEYTDYMKNKIVGLIKLWNQFTRINSTAIGKLGIWINILFKRKNRLGTFSILTVFFFFCNGHISLVGVWTYKIKSSKMIQCILIVGILLPQSLAHPGFFTSIGKSYLFYDLYCFSFKRFHFLVF